MSLRSSFLLCHVRARHAVFGMRIAFIFTGLVFVAAANDAAAALRPNILVILADDLGYADLGFQGGKDIPTPHLDALAASGVRCTNGYVSGPYCSPTRQAF